ncbi:MAG: PDDEXK-like family protein [Phycisphaerales bacterium]
MTTGTPLSPLDPMQALERFIVDNDDLLQLEERVGRFNIFDALNISRVEIRHSNFLAWLLDPAESHSQGHLFLNAILMDLLKQARDNGMTIPLSPIELDGADFRGGVDIRREWRNIDLLIQCNEPQFLVAVENKIDASEHSDQLARYRKTIEQHFPGRPTLYVFLTREGDEPSDDAWCNYSYADVFRVLSRVRRTQAKAIGQDVLTFLDHYLNLIESRFMSDPQIDELCQRIYKNHKQAIDLIAERVGSVKAQIIRGIYEQLAARTGIWWVSNYTDSRIYFCPQCWLDILPPIRSDHLNPRFWLACDFRINSDTLELWCYACPASDANLRERVVRRLTGDRDEFGFRLNAKEVSPQWATFFRKSIVKELGSQDVSQVVDIATTQLTHLHPKMEKAAEALRPIIA